MARTRISSKGQVVLPKEVRDRQGWAAGTELEVETCGNLVVLRPVRTVLRSKLEDVVGCIPYDGPPVSVEEMDAAVEQAACRMWEEFERDRQDR